MIKNLLDVCGGYLQTWIPPAPPSRFNTLEEVETYQKHFKEGYEEVLSRLIGSVARDHLPRGTPKPRIVIITRINSLGFETKGIRENPASYLSSSSGGLGSLENFELLENLTPAQEEKRKRILAGKDQFKD